MEKTLAQKKDWLATKPHRGMKPCKHQKAVATWVLHWNGKTIIIEDNGER